MPDVFLTYSSEDEGAARRLAGALGTCGWSTFWNRNIPPGKSWDEVIEAALSAARCQLVLWSNDSVNSIGVLEEARGGLRREILICAYLDDICAPSHFAAAPSAGLLEWDGAELAPGCDLTSRISALIGPPAPLKPNRPPAAHPPAPATRIEQAKGGGTAATVTPPPRPLPAGAARQRPAATTAAAGTSARRALKSPPEIGSLKRHGPKRRVDEPDMVMVPAGTFPVSSALEGPSADVVRIVKSFAIGRFPVTFDEYDRFARDTGQPPPSDQGWGRGQRPVINVLPEDALAFTRWLSTRSGKSYRLPTRTEWKYVHGVGGMIYEWSGVSQESDLGDDEWYWPKYGLMTHPVNALRPNDLGVYDLQGNVWEWVGEDRADSAGALCLSTDKRLDFVGFRVVCELE